MPIFCYLYRSQPDGVMKSSYFLKRLRCGDLLFLDHLMKPFKNEFRWNDFFQFVLFFSLAPMPAIAYGIKIKLIITSNCEYIKRYQQKHNYISIIYTLHIIYRLICCKYYTNYIQMIILMLNS